MKKSVATQPKVWVVPIRHFDPDAMIGSFLEDSKFRELSGEGVEIRRENGLKDGRPCRQMHFGLECYELVVTTTEEKFEEVMARLEAVVVEHGFCVIDADTPRDQLAALRAPKKKRRRRQVPLPEPTLADIFATA